MSLGSLLGVGIYSIPEASRLTGVSADAIRRWLWGYRRRSADGTPVHSAPLWSPQIPVIDHSKALGFRDLIEIRFVDHFKKNGLSLQSIRGIIGAATGARRGVLPLSTVKFKTDGKRVLAEVLEAGEALWSSICEPASCSFRSIGTSSTMRWSIRRTTSCFAGGRWGRIAGCWSDPKRNFGQPISPEGVPTHVLANAFRAEGTIESVVSWYKVEPESVRDAVEFEQRLQAA